jgi:hypothetical protein
MAQELFVLFSDNVHLQFQGVLLRITPSRLSKTDRPGHVGKPYFIRPWAEDLSICPVNTVRLILEKKMHLHVRHNFLFFHWTPPYNPMDVDSFQRCVGHCLTHSGISATPGSTRLVAASAALARGFSVNDILKMVDWSRLSIFFCHYSSL